MLRTFAREIDIGEGDTLPTEFCLLKHGVNETSKGSILFDDAAASSVMSEYARGGVELPIDLNHEMLDPQTMRVRRDAGDALGWFKLELRGKDLWMTNIRWNDEGRERLLKRKQRYFSPAVMHLENAQAVELINVALVARPATYNTRPLIAASRSSVPVNETTRARARALATK